MLRIYRLFFCRVTVEGMIREEDSRRVSYVSVVSHQLIRVFSLYILHVQDRQRRRRSRLGRQHRRLQLEPFRVPP